MTNMSKDSFDAIGFIVIATTVVLHRIAYRNVFFLSFSPLSHLICWSHCVQHNRICLIRSLVLFFMRLFYVLAK